MTQRHGTVHEAAQGGQGKPRYKEVALRIQGKKLTVRGRVGESLTEGLARAEQKSKAGQEAKPEKAFDRRAELRKHLSQLATARELAAEATKLKQRVDAAYAAVRISRQALSDDFRQRLFAVGAEVISIKPKEVQCEDIPNVPFTVLKLVPTPGQRRDFIKKFMAVGMGRKDATLALDDVLGRFGRNAFSAMDSYFEDTALFIAGEMIRRKLNSYAYAGPYAMLGKMVTVKKGEIVSKEGGHTLNEDAKQRVRLALLSLAVAGEFVHSELWHVQGKMNAALGIFVSRFENNDCRGV